jgi:hypothetical protein
MRNWSLARPRPIAFHVPKETRYLLAVVRGYHSIWAAVGEEFGALAKNRYRDIVSICSDCVWYRSKVTDVRENFRMFKFSCTMVVTF